MGNYIKTPISRVPSKYHKSRRSHLDKIHFRAVVRKVNHKGSVQRLCLLSGKKRPVFYFTSFCSGFSMTGECLYTAYILAVQSIICGSCLDINPETYNIGLDLKNNED